MLFNPNWIPETKTDVLSFEGLIAWLEKQPAKKAYDYDNCKGGCLYGLYMASHGVGWEVSGACSSIESGPERAAFCSKVYAQVSCQNPWTFGAALTRARAALIGND